MTYRCEAWRASVVASLAVCVLGGSTSRNRIPSKALRTVGSTVGIPSPLPWRKNPISYLAAREAPKSWLQENAICLKPRYRGFAREEISAIHNMQQTEKADTRRALARARKPLAPEFTSLSTRTRARVDAQHSCARNAVPHIVSRTGSIQRSHARP